MTTVGATRIKFTDGRLSPRERSAFVSVESPKLGDPLDQNRCELVIPFKWLRKHCLEGLNVKRALRVALPTEKPTYQPDSSHHFRS
jgi:hypothetical protein